MSVISSRCLECLIPLVTTNKEYLDKMEEEERDKITDIARAILSNADNEGNVATSDIINSSDDDSNNSIDSGGFSTEDMFAVNKSDIENSAALDDADVGMLDTSDIDDTNK